jgi:Tfp pilus assembly protein PilO
VALLPSNQRDQKMVLLALCGVLAVFSYWYFYLDPQAKELAVVEEHVETLTHLNERAKAELARGDPEKLRQDALEYRRNLDAMRQLVPTSNEVPALLEQVSTAARRVGLDLGGVEPEPVIPGDQFDTYRYRITLEGDYHAVGAFLANVGGLTRIIAPVNVQLRPATSTEPVRPGQPAPARQPLETQFQIQTYVARSAPAAAPAAADTEPAQSETP